MKKIILLVVLLFIAVAGWTVLRQWSQRTSDVAYAPEATYSLVYSCDEQKSVHALFTGKDVSVTLSDGRVLSLTQTVSADGVRYANPDESFVFWSKGNGALVLEDNTQKSYIGCIVVAPEPEGVSLPQIYSNSSEGFSIRLPADYTISGSTFTIPSTLTQNTNLSQDTSVRVKTIAYTGTPQDAMCTADLFFDDGFSGVVQEKVENGTTYSVASSMDAGAGNRYEQTVYAIPGTNPCIAIQYFVHYGVIENYPETVTVFDREGLMEQFDHIRSTLIIE